MAPSLSLELDELDDLILGSTGFGRGPPPEKFVCSVSGELIREPILDPHCDPLHPRYFDKSSIVALATDEDEGATACWPLSGGLLFIMSSPASSGMDTPAAVVGYGFPIIYWGAAIVGCTGEWSSISVIGVILFALFAFIALAYFILQSRKKIGTSLSAKSLDEYLTNTVFVYSGTQIATMVYLCSHTMKCLGKNPDLTTRDEVLDACGASIRPSFCISMMILMVMVFKLCMAPLSSSAAETSLSGVCNIEDLTLKLKIQMLSIFTAFFGNIILFGLQEEGPEPDWMWYLAGAVVCNIAFVLIVEFAFMFVSRQRQSAVPIEHAEGPAAGKEQLRSKNSGDVLEKMTGNLI